MIVHLYKISTGTMVPTNQRLTEALLAAWNQPSEQSVYEDDCVPNRALGFAAVAAGTPFFVLNNAKRWLAMRGEEGSSEHIISGHAAAALEVHDILSKDRWEITRTQGGFYNAEENSNAFVALINLFEQLEGETEVKYARLCGLWMRMPKSLRGIVSLHMVDAAYLKCILLNFVDNQHKCGHILLNSCSNSAELLADFCNFTRDGCQQMTEALLAGHRA